MTILAFLQALASCPVIDNEEREALADPSYQPISLDWRRHLLSAEQTKVASHLCNQILAEDPNSSLIPDIIGKNITMNLAYLGKPGFVSPRNCSYIF